MTQQFGAHSTVDDVVRGLDLSGKTAVVTGASGGLGLQTTRALAQAGVRVVMAARDPQKNSAAAASLRERIPGAALSPVTLDLGDLASVRACARDILAAHARIDLLINNAGIMACPLGRTAEGCELQFGTNHIGHFLLTCLLADALKQADRARIVCLTSGGHRTSPVDFEDPHFERRPYNNWLAYGQSKTANALFAVALAERLGGFGITANAVHPGSIHTDLGRHLTEADIRQLTEWAKHGPAVEFKTPEQGAATQVWAATSEALAEVSGRYLEDCRIAEVDTTPMAASGYMPYALDPEAARRLWHLSETIVGQRFDIG